jgi:hypothetical protein
MRWSEELIELAAYPKKLVVYILETRLKIYMNLILGPQGTVSNL